MKNYKTTKIYFNNNQMVGSLSSNYQGGNAASVQRQIAQTQYQNVLDTFDQQKNLIQKQRNVATTTDENSQKMRDITRISAEETDHLIHADQAQLDQMKAQLDVLQSSGASADSIATLQGSINQLQGGINQLNASGRTIGYQS